jgi:hypothetical protein
MVLAESSYNFTKVVGKPGTDVTTTRFALASIDDRS